MPRYMLGKSRFRIISASGVIWFCCLSLSSNFCLAKSRSGSTDAWCAAAAGLPFPNKTAYGRVYNHSFTADQCFITYEPVVVGRHEKKRSLELTLQQGALPSGKETYNGITRIKFCEPRVAFKINFWCGDLSKLVGKTIIVKAGSPINRGVNYPMVSVETNTVARQDSATYAAARAWPNTKKTYLIGGGEYGYSMRLTFSQMKDNRLPGYIVLRVADPEQSFIEGYFYADVKDDPATFMHLKPLDNLKPTGEFPAG